MSETSIQALVAHLPANPDTVPVMNPANGKKIYDLPQMSVAQVESAIAAARVAQRDWAKTPVAERSKLLVELHALLLEDETKLLDLLQLETGKSRAHAFEETAGAIASASYYARIAPKYLSRRKTKPGVPVLTRTYVDQVPVGVVGIITPWNYPLALTMLDVLPALIAGNAVIQKADNQTALTVLFARHLAIEAGIPAELWTVVVGDGETVGNAITDNVDYVAFTGSTATGRKVAERAARRLIGCSLELGGKNPLIVLEGANIKRAAEIAIAGAFGSAGQLCVSIERVYVPNRIKDEFLAEIAKRTESLTVGRSNDFSMDIGSLTGYNQLQRMMGFIDDAVSTGATVVAGGKQLTETGPYFYSPTVITNVNQNARMYRQEVFGPVVDVEGYEDLDDAIKMANDTDYGLNASVVGPEREAIKVAEKLNAGSVNINEGFRATFASMETPMGGFKSSGQGRRNGPGGLLRFTEAKAIGVARGAIKLPSRAKDYNRMAPLMRMMLKRLK
ncbi:succinic semialdehyde dehydrogenase [Rhodoluna lacicola]|uniref:NAD-dependent aldehyde dehydrogenase n=1 Tax=Rhodoluna lacicola TaxID=529884 RepID=A0A060JLU4_9MICO|nr:succinic semialdehyde dehydrogenase [Rhodoluna lacicola]AIC47199.1 NAD-dependent aldehyde dehydrogenase [Rhodoluna lacicola]